MNRAPAPEQIVWQLFPPRQGYALDIYLPWVQAAQIRELNGLFVMVGKRWPSLS